jgi:ribosomal protein L22
MKTASTILRDARISFKKSQVLCHQIKGKKFEREKKFLQNLVDRKVTLDGKYYPKTASKFLEMFQSLEANAKVKKLDAGKLWIKQAKADKGLVFMRPRSRFRLRARKAKSASVEIVVEER